MRKPWDIAGDDLDRWASDVRASAALPSLVRRLLFATTPLASIEMRADGGTRLGGLDGVVRAREATEFCPAGISVWETSVEQKVKTKLDKDFQKRTGEPAPTIPRKAATYVAVTARRFAKKLDWVTVQRKLGRWADVRVLDADDLAAWLTQAPAVARWFAEELGKPVADLRDIGALLDAWRLRTSPPLPWKLVLSGEERKVQSGKLLEWLEQPSSRPLLVRGETREESLLFAAAALKEQPNAEAWLSRALIVDSTEALRWALSVQTATPLVVLVAFEGADPGQIAAARAHGILAGDRRTPELPGATLELGPIPWHPIAQALIKAGFKQEDAWRRVRDAGGSLAKLQGLYGYIELPDWAQGLPAPEILALLLAGAWTPKNEADREVMRRLGGDPDRVEQLCVELERRGDVERGDEAWGPHTFRWKSPRNVWKQLADRLTDGQLDRFQAVVLDVLGAPDPTYELPRPERWSAAVTGHALPHSSALREGLALSMVMLSQSDRRTENEPQRSRGSDSASSLIYRLFRPELGWKPWASLSGLLPTLAEAAPDAFLDALEQSLARGAVGVVHLLAEEGSSSSRPTPHVGLLWAIETLGWSPEKRVLQRVALALARLTAQDNDRSALRKVANRPGRSLAKLLHIRCPQSRSSVDDRLALLELLLKDEDKEVSNIGWDLSLGMLGFLRGMFMPSHKPEYLPWEPVDALREVSDEETLKQRDGATRLVLAHVGADVTRWTGLLDLILQMPTAQAQHVLDALEKVRVTMIGSTGALRSALREQLRWGRKRADEVDPAVVDRIDKIYRSLTPDDLIEKHAWLFSVKIGLLPDPVEGGWQEEEKQKDVLRQSALKEIWPLPDRWDKLAALSRAADHPWTIGAALAGPTFADEMEEYLLRSPQPGLDSSILRAFFGERFKLKGEAKAVPWSRQVLQRLLTDGRHDEAGLIARALPSGAPVWDMIDALGEPLRAEYWKKDGGLYGDHPSEDWERAAENLLAAGNVLAALDTVRNGNDKLSAATAVRVLERLQALPPSERRTPPDFLFGYAVERALARIERDADIDPSVTLGFELAFAPDLDDRSRLHGHLSATLGAHPELFVQLLQVMYRREGEPPLPEGDEAQRVRTVAETAYDILSSWESYPGSGLPDDDREARLEAWATAVLDAATADGRGGPAASEVAKVLARAPEGPDGLWPCLAARRLLRTRKYPNLKVGLEIARKNRRGVTTRGLLEGGVQERVVANSYREAAQQMQDEFPEAAALLDSLARAYDDEAEPWDTKARRHRLEHGEAEEAPAAAPAEAAPGGPLSRLELRGVGPASALTLGLAPRLNLITGDNSLGKTLVLDAAWWCLTGSFAQPDRLPKPTVKVRNGKVLKSKAAIVAQAGDRAVTGTYSALHERWTVSSGQPLAPDLAIYARVDGGFSIWDSIRNVAPRDNDEVDLSKGYHFSQKELWEGLFPRRSTTPLCNGLIADAVRWRSERPRAHDLLVKALQALSPPQEKLDFGLPRRFSVKEDVRNHPVLLLPYGAVFAVHASSAVQRVLGLAYALVWAVTEMHAAAEVAGRAPVGSVTMLIDEIEAHLHPKWQRTILRALLTIMDKIAPEAKVQLIVTTHAPLVLASVEQPFDPSTDALLDFNLTTTEDGEREAAPMPVVKKVPWVIRGDVNAWLGSEVFDHTEPRSPDAEKAMKAAKEALDDPSTERKQGRKVHRMLQRALSEIDPFWLRWRYLAEKRGWLP